MIRTSEHILRLLFSDKTKKKEFAVLKTAELKKIFDNIETAIGCNMTSELKEQMQTLKSMVISQQINNKQSIQCHKCADYELILDVNFCPFCGFEFVRG
jgi:predicted Zn-ribbon and HTH transcriptional regulator